MSNIDPVLANAAAAKSAALSAPVDALTVGDAAATRGSTSAPTASSGTWDVRTLQQWLKDRGYYPYKVDGYYGPKTTEAVRAFQRDANARGLYPYKVDGKWGPYTQAAANQWGSSGGAAGGATDTGGAAASSPAAVTPDDPMVLAMQMYGWLAAFLDHPEVGPMLRQAAEGRWSAEKLQAALYGTTWWRTTQASARLWMAEEQADPATAAGKVNAEVERVRKTFLDMGVTVAEDRIASLARNSLMFGWSDDQLLDAMWAESQHNPTIAAQLTKGSFAEQVRRGASDYAVPVSESAVEKWSTQLAFGQATPEQFQSWLSQAAAANYPHFADDIGRGFTVRQLADPYLQLAANTLGVDSDSLSFSDPMWNAAINATGSDGKRRAMTLAEWGDYIRTDPRYGYEYTEEAQGKAFEVVNRLQGIFGK